MIRALFLYLQNLEMISKFATSDAFITIRVLIANPILRKILINVTVAEDYHGD